MGRLNQASMTKLGQVDKRLQAIVTVAVARVPFDCVISEGIRTLEQMKINYGKGRTAAQCAVKGIEAKYAQPTLPQVTWLKNPLKSKHAEGKAVDIYPLVDGKLADGRKNADLYDTLYHAMMGAAAELKTRIRYGGDWDEDGKLHEKGETDSVHFELSGD